MIITGEVPRRQSLSIIDPFHLLGIFNILSPDIKSNTRKERKHLQNSKIFSLLFCRCYNVRFQMTVSLQTSFLRCWFVSHRHHVESHVKFPHQPLAVALYLFLPVLVCSAAPAQDKTPNIKHPKPKENRNRCTQTGFIFTLRKLWMV